MIFAAGFGTRMRPLTLTRPKPLIEVAGQTLIDRTLDLARTVRPSRIVVNAHYMSEMLETHLSSTEARVIVEAPEILDTGGGLRNAFPKLGTDPVMTSNSDAIWVGPNPFETLLAHWRPETMDALLLCVPFSRTVGRAHGGDFNLNEEGLISRQGDFVYGGIQILHTDLLADIEDHVFSLNRVWDLMHARQRLFGAVYPGMWCDIGTPEGIPVAEDLLKSATHA